MPMVPRIFVMLLMALLALHLFWTYVIFKIALQTQTGGPVDDIREESDDDKCDTDDHITKNNLHKKKL